MKEPKWWLDTESLQGSDFAMSTAFSALMRKVFIWMALALVITGVTAYGVATTPSLLIAIVTNKALFWGLIIAELALVFAVSGAINRLSLATATLLFIFLAYSMPAIIQTFFITAGTFGVMALVGYTTKTDLTSLGKLLFMALIGLVIATVVNMFVGSTGFDYILSYVGVLIFVGLTAYDTQKIKQMCMQAPDAGEHMQKLALLGALSLYLDFINLFLYLLRIFGNNKD